MTDYAPAKAAAAMREANANTLLLAQIESREAIQDIDAIVSVDGTDVALIGPNDLSVSLGIPDQLDAPAEVEAIEKVVAAAKRNGKASGIHIGNAEAARKWRERGMTVLASGHDVSLQHAAGKAALTEMRR
jgi:2-keto-3-deoxy-L-rhamnonate aldolase RhmA